MRQIILLILLFFVGQWFVKALRRQDARTSTRTGEDARGQSGASEANGANRAAKGGTNGAGQSPGNRAARHQLPEPMIRCVECGVHAPKSDSVTVDGRIFCGHDHAQRFATRVAQTRGREGR
ncbi:PP0621 family protein [Paraburkholderia sp. SARCC-3016]|uniref:PP0621 family protein n=1 Tax=Paraburkholderia sp. SARCC-3016 TaxID=3058611 RepID=UPI002807629A|nr:PP0621 family protein [Paraburkholderia sp. SARCC-3016]MDQ7976611.1 PP0621 family protein [Paraburkholderia sp. SARCC-3016]